eukprot:SAG31_NODE_2762_length_5129_cov_3.337972_4_plen_34_part_00
MKASLTLANQKCLRQKVVNMKCSFLVMEHSVDR